MLRMPGKSFQGEFAPLDDRERELETMLRADVEALAGRIGDRNVFRYEAYVEAADYLEAELREAGYTIERQSYPVQGKTCWNLISECKGASRAKEIVVVGAHYDSVMGVPAANDNASGVAAVLALARHFAEVKPQRTVRFVLFANEEPPFFQTQAMGSLVYARRCRERQEDIVAMLSLETIGYYSDRPGSQSYPAPFNLFYPSTGNFIGFIGNVGSKRLVHEVVASFRSHTQFPSEGAAVPGQMVGVGWSDHWSFWQAGYSALMVTDTAPFRYPHYHAATDTPDKLDYARMARVVAGLERVLRELSHVEGATESNK